MTEDHADRPLRVFLVDDQALVRSGFAMLIESAGDMVVVGESSDGESAVAALAATQADVVLMDVRMPHLDGVEATKQLTARDDPAKVLILTTFDLDEYVFAALQAGASGFMLKDSRASELLNAIRAVADGDSVVAPSATKRLLQQMLPDIALGGPIPAQALAPDAAHRHEVASQKLATLTAREREVILQIANGATNAEVGAALAMAEGTVKTHINHLFAKLDTRNRVGLVLFAYEVGLITA
ncbi:MAG: response regulator transcription factor [Propionibacteriaceae bacterium]|jgi:DNA-binding NarL/FixJ family response regulator|nr:response regulator transcription factor [Propionibacteriaceae bacterium]